MLINIREPNSNITIINIICNALAYSTQIQNNQNEIRTTILRKKISHLNNFYFKFAFSFILYCVNEKKKILINYILKLKS